MSKLPTHTKVVRIHQFGAPSEVLKIEEEPLREINKGEVLIRMQAAPVHPSDINVIQGTYGIRPGLPAIVGNEGVGVIADVGEGVKNLKVGDSVRPPSGIGMWQQYLIAPEKDCLKMPANLLPEQAAMLYINPPTAWRALHDFVHLKPGDWIIQNAANSALGQCVIQIAKAKGWRTINLVRQQAAIAELKAIGADVVLIDNDEVPESVKDIVHDTPIRLGLNTVSGDSAIHIIDCMASSSTVVTLGGLSRQPLKIPNKYLIFQDIRFVGFWVTQWFRQADPHARDVMLEDLANLVRQHKLKIKVQERFPLHDVVRAVELAQKEGRKGKILLQLDA